MCYRAKWHGVPIVQRRRDPSSHDYCGGPASAVGSPAGAGPPQAPRILLVEDFEPVLEALRATLLGMGFRVLAARDGIEGLEIARSEAIDLLLTDISMPRMNGIELARELRRRQPELPLVFLSGLLQLEAAREVLWGGPVELIEKPCTSSSIAEALRSALAQRRTGASTAPLAARPS